MYRDFDLFINNPTEKLKTKYKVAALPCLIICDIITGDFTYKLIELKGLNESIKNYARP